MTVVGIKQNRPGPHMPLLCPAGFSISLGDLEKGKTSELECHIEATEEGRHTEPETLNPHTDLKECTEG